MSTATQQQTSIETVKTTLKTYSRFMRRDFLAILVKMSAKNFNVRTVRCDWRTRSGMLAFLQSVWERLFPLLSQDTIFKWYCQNFDSQEKVFSIRKFMMYIFANWQTHADFLKQEETLSFLKINQNEAEILISNPKSKHSQAWSQPVGAKLLEIIEDFAANKANQIPASHVPISQPSIMRKSMSMPSMQQILSTKPTPAPKPAPVQAPQAPPMMQMQVPPQETTTQQHVNFIQINEPMLNDFSSESYSSIRPLSAAYDSDVSTEDIFDPFNLELGEYNPHELPTINPMDYPYSFDPYSL